jgi:hypothetical protein
VETENENKWAGYSWKGTKKTQSKKFQGKTQSMKSKGKKAAAAAAADEEEEEVQEPPLKKVRSDNGASVPLAPAPAGTASPSLIPFTSQRSALNIWRKKNTNLQAICGKGFAQLINRAIPGSGLVQRGADYYIDFSILDRDAHISFHKRGIPGNEGAFHIKLNDDTVSVRLLLIRRFDNVLQFFGTKTESRGLTPEITSVIITIIESINRILHECSFTGEVSPGGGSPMYGGTRRYKRQQKKRYTRRSK